LVETKRTFSGVRSLAGDADILVIVQQVTAMVYRAGPGGALQKLSEAAIEGNAQRGILRDGILYILNDKGAVLCWNIDKRGAPSSLKPLQASGVVDFAVGKNDGILLTDLEFLLPFEIEHASGPGVGATKVRLKSGKGFTLQSVNGYGQPIATGNPSLPEIQHAARVFIDGRRCAILSQFGGMRLYRLERGGMRLAGAFNTSGFAINLFVENGLLYLANSLDGVRIARVGATGALNWIGHIQTAEARDVALTGTNLIIADGSGGLKVADVSNPASPRIIGRHESPYFMSAVAVRDGRAYCAGGLGGVEIVDVSQPSRPSLVWRQDCSESRGIDVDGRFLYFSDGYVGFQIYSLTKDKPVPVSTLDTPGWNCDCLVAKNTAYLADGGAGIVIVDVGNRKKPRTLGSLSLNTITRVVYVFNNTLFAAGHTKGIAAVDVSNPAKPAIAAWYDTADDGRGVFADANFVYAASGSGGVYVLKYLHR
ncbi:MAG: hypothetical protein PHD74_10745, partial [Candidatus Krumholzibacteria bacterium]|nr:hypothetical protein [Candidatus Krumholzibacteria bacterium]